MSEYRDLLERVRTPGSAASWRHEAKAKAQASEKAKYAATSLGNYMSSLRKAINRGDKEITLEYVGAMARDLATVAEEMGSPHADTLRQCGKKIMR